MHVHADLLSCVFFSLFFYYFFFLNQGLKREFHQSHRNRSGFQPAEGGVSPVVWSTDTRPSSPPDPDVSGWGGGNGLDIWSESTWREADSGWWRLPLDDLKKKKKKSPCVQIIRCRSCDSGIINQFHLAQKATPGYPGCVKVTGLYRILFFIVCKHVRYSYQYFLVFSQIPFPTWKIKCPRLSLTQTHKYKNRPLAAACTLVTVSEFQAFFWKHYFKMDQFPDFSFLFLRFILSHTSVRSVQLL